MKCKNCGKEILEDSSFCRYCGTSIEERIPLMFEAKKPKKKSHSGKFWAVIIASCVAVIAIVICLVIFLGKGSKTTIALSETNTQNAAEDSSENNYISLEDAQVGDTVIFGTYEQDNDTANGKENIEWIVKDKKEGKILLVSKYAIDCVRYNTVEKETPWDNSYLRFWLNSTFFKSAFNNSEQEIILSTELSNDNWMNEKGLCEDTTDKIFLLTWDEYDEYFGVDEEYFCEATDYVKANSDYMESDDEGCWLWSRSNDYVGFDGFRIYDGLKYGCVQPSMWVKVE